MAAKNINIGNIAPTVSIIMVTYNHGRYIEQAINSILSQNFNGSIELIIGDDCSTDDTTKIVHHFHENYPETIRLIKSDNNVGAHANFKRCIRACNGAYIALCEGDDYWHEKNKLQLQIDYLESKPFTGAVHSDFSYTMLIDGKWKTIACFNKRYRKKIPSGNIFHQLIAQNFILTCTLCARTELVKNFLDSDLPIDNYLVGDWPLYLFISSTHEIEYFNQSLATYRKTLGSITNSGYENDIARAEDSIKMTNDFCKIYKLPESVRLAAHRNAARHILRASLVAKNMSRYEHYWSVFKSTHPNHMDVMYLKLERIVVYSSVLHCFYSLYSKLRSFITNRWLYR